MTANELDEAWTDEDLDLLLALARANLDESLRCHHSSASHAAFVLLAGSFEAVLLGAFDRPRGRRPRAPRRATEEQVLAAAAKPQAPDGTSPAGAHDGLA